MSALVPFKAVVVREEDVPGASLPLSPISANSVTSLKRYLKCRGVQCQNKRKTDLVKLVEECEKENRPICQTVDNGVWLSNKAKEQRSHDINAAARSVDVFPVTGWKDFPSRPIPHLFCYGMIYKYIILTACVENTEVQDEDTCNDTVLRYDTAKPLKKGRRYFLSGHVIEMMDAISKNKHYCLKSKVHASMNDAKYSVCVMVHAETADILDASCNCKASAMGRCSHVAALLFTLEDYTIQFGNNPVACTSQLCSWNQGKKRKSSEPIYSKKYSCKRDPARTIGFNPLTTEQSSTLHLQHEPLRVCQEHTQDCERKAGGFGETQPIMWELLFEFVYDDYELTEENLDILIVSVNQLRESLVFGYHGTCGQVPGTLLQTHSAEWHRIRSLLITASVATRFLSARPETVYNLLREHMWYPKHFSTPATQYGQKNETNGRNAYIATTANSVQESGLWVNSEYPGLGASPDGIVYCKKTNSWGILEIKCPFVLKEMMPEEFENLNRNQVSNFCLKKVGDTMFLKKTHKYYMQVQMQMSVVGVQWCDFVVWSPKGVFVERVQFDRDFWEPLGMQLLELHAIYLCPEYFEMRIPRKLSAINIPNNYVM